MTRPAAGRQGRQEYVAVPAALFGVLLQEVEDLAELRCALRAIFVLQRKRGPLPSVTAAEMAADPVLLRAMGGPSPAEAAGAVAAALERCARHGLLLRLQPPGPSAEEEGGPLYLLDTPANRRAAELAPSGLLQRPGPLGLAAAEAAPETPDIFTLYEQNLGPIYPMAAERLKAMEEEYPAPWLREAFQEAVRHNKRSLAYVEAILRRWRDHGKGDGETGRRPGKAPVEDLLRRRGGSYGPLANG